MLIVCGLYMVLWGKSKEMNKCLQLTPSESIGQLALKDVAVTTPNPLNENQIQDTNANKSTVN